MNFSAKTEYGVRLMVELGRQHGGQPTSLKAIAEGEGLPLSYLEHVVADLKRAGLVEATRGAHGGYRLGRPPSEISMDEVVSALEGTIAPMECFVTLPTHRVSCSHEADRGRGGGPRPAPAAPGSRGVYKGGAGPGRWLPAAFPGCRPRRWRPSRPLEY